MTSQAPSTRRGRPPKGAGQLTRAGIVEATLDVIGSDGVGAVGIRAVARALGVDPKSLYNHVDGKDGLLDAVAEHLLGSIELPALGGDLRSDLRAIAEAFRDRALRHPAAAALVLTRQLGSVEGLSPIQAVLEVLRAAGCDSEEAVHLLRTMLATLIGTLLREVSAGPTYGTSDTAGIAARRTTLEQSGLPAVAEAAPYLARFDSQAEFDYAMDLALDAIVARVSGSARSC
ncbi:TetR/AcrR family transcriptional regulator C-terminal domain-containing protein [Nocardia beijingensis]|uniref:TetR/AcrR family transcriptional regulator n=1 Tax=Nocardia beijingensis TaxID=95162 RepID=UPI001894849E|nr:TetR family transcriptional regulator [Nocardia beijingensis]MBF6465915.1 TetR/AcrR family transcriptional regulator C-terminal domain-containing protein [Nocardia beijingensis]